MGKNKRARLIDNIDGKRLCVVASVNNEDEINVDSRSMKPVGIIQGEDTIYMQEINRIEFPEKNKQNNTLSFFSPNNVGILLSIANKALNNAQIIYREEIDPNKCNHSDLLDGTTGTEINEKTLVVYEFIECIQTSIVFGYTAIEAFTNLSIDEEYQYKNVINSKGIIEVYDKKAIERWLSLGVKISEILVEIYECESLKNDKLWSKFKEFESYRNQIIHQKSIDSNIFYENYFNPDIFELCKVPEKVIKFFFKKGNDKGISNRFWPLVINADNNILVFSGPNTKIGEQMGVIKDF